MARTLHKFRVWFSTVDGERFYQDVEAMNVESAVKKANATFSADPAIHEIGGHKREWSMSFVQDMEEREGMQQVSIVKGQSIPPLTKPSPSQSIPPKGKTI